MANANYRFRNLDEALPKLCKAVMDGEEVGSRAGRTMELNHVAVTYDFPQQRETVNQLRKHSVVAQIAEVVWMLAGRDDIDWLKNYVPRAGDFSEDGVKWSGAYGPRIRKWRGRNGEVDQLAQVVETLKKTPLSRQAVIGIWDPGHDNQEHLLDRPCNDLIIFTNRLGSLDAHVTIRSNDLIWGHSGINYFEWSVLLELVAGMVGVRPGSLHFSIASLHIYDRHWKRAGEIASNYRGEDIYKENNLDAKAFRRSVEGFDELLKQWFDIEEKIRNGNSPNIFYLIDGFPEPLLRSWLYVLNWYWTGNDHSLNFIAGTRLHTSVRVGVQPKHDELKPLLGEVVQELPEGWTKVDEPPKLRAVVMTESDKHWSVQMEEDMEKSESESWAPDNKHLVDFVESVEKLHTGKSAAYGDSWKRRGEILGILANIARKVDRIIGGQDTTDENQADTAVDLLVYASMYRWWLTDEGRAPMPPVDLTWQAGVPFSDKPVEPVAKLLQLTSTNEAMKNLDIPGYEALIKSTFADIEKQVIGSGMKYPATLERLVDRLVEVSFWLAFNRWECKECEYRGADAD